jgi:uncharacterized protein (DUF1697 family)
MTTWIALLRGINVSGQRMIKMDALKSLFESLHLKNVRTYLQSGNVVFDCPEKEAEGLGKRIEAKIRHDLGFEVPVILRSSVAIRNTLRDNPFLTERKEDTAHLYVIFLAEEPAAGGFEKLAGITSQEDEFIPAGKEIYLFCPGGYGNTKFSNGFFEGKLKMTATTRNWKTVTALAAMVLPAGTS